MQNIQKAQPVLQLPAQINSQNKKTSFFSTEVSLFRQLKKHVYAKRPILKDILTESGFLSLYDFSKNRIKNNPYIFHPERKEQFITVLQQCVQDLLGSEMAKSVAQQLRKYPYVNTADHHGVLDHPGHITINALEGMPLAELGDPALQNVIVLTCANISFDNLSFPRGLRFHSFLNDKITESQLAFFGRTVDSRPVVNFRPYTYESIQTMKNMLQQEVHKGKVAKQTGEKLVQVIDEVFFNPQVLARHNFSDQASIISSALWKKFWGNHAASMPNLIYVEQEEIANQLIILYHLYQDTIIHQILFNKTYHKLILKYFDGIMGAFSSQNNSGTFLFWALPKGKKYRIQLRKKGRMLVSPDETYQIELTPQAIHGAIVNKEIFPSVLLTFLIISFYHGIRLLGGHNQTTYLTQMKEGYIAMLKELGDKKSAEECAIMETTDMVFFGPLAYMKDSYGTRVPATGLDLILYGNNQTLPSLKETAKGIMLREIIYAQLIPYLYRTYYPKEQQETALLTITEDGIEKALELDKKYYSFTS